ncbi:Lipid-binding SYLF domain-containing protein [Candidatus Electrothrix marina]|uniref:Lipid-binding SYLF domain-containing protein n=1 Tax=Candidatus Electrothrix marina TaxID=1859130 RepID=A0A444JE69_9BACT|nr:Lipid-binding SYLF domain-containing protein [Candidatus Electrothrix marina]
MFFLKRTLFFSEAAKGAVGLLFCCVLLVYPSRGFSKTASLSQDLLDAEELVTKSDAVLRVFLEDPNLKWFRRNIGTARGVFIAPQMLRGAFLIGSSRGSGLLFARDPAGKWSYPGFYAINSVSMGLQIGADASEIILLVMTEQGMNAMLSPEFKIDSRIDSQIMVAAGTMGDGPPQDSADILAFARSMRGIINGVSLGGAVITPRSSLNTAYYGRTVSLEDILVRQRARNDKAESLRRRIATE